MDVLAVFKEGQRWPRPIKMKIFENGSEIKVDVSEILKIEDVGAGGVSRVEYTCLSAGSRGKIKYKLKYYYNTGAWEFERL